MKLVKKVVGLFKKKDLAKIKELEKEEYKTDLIFQSINNILNNLVNRIEILEIKVKKEELARKKKELKELKAKKGKNAR